MSDAAGTQANEPTQVEGVNMGWLTLYTKPNMERYVDQVLQSRGIVTYLPLVYEFSKHRQRVESSPFFPCYLFAYVDPLSSSFRLLEWTPGLKQIVSFDGRVAWMPDELIAQVRDCAANWTRNGERNKTSDFCRGERVRITTGSLEGIEALFDRSVSKAGRVRILLRILGRLTQCEIDSACLEKIG